MTNYSPEGQTPQNLGTEVHPVERALSEPAELPPQEHQYGRIVAENKRKKRNKMIGSGLVGTLLLGGGLFAGSKLAGGESEPGPGPTPPADTAPVVPGNEPAPVEGDPVRPEEDHLPDPTTSEELTPQPVTINAENFADFSNQDILGWYELDGQRLSALGTSGVREFVTERGGQVQTYDPAEFFSRRDSEGVIRYTAMAESEDGLSQEIQQLYPSAENNISLFLNTVLANRNLFSDIDTNRSGSTAMALQGLTETFLLESHRDMVNGTDGYDQADSYLINNLVEFAKSQPEGTVVTNFDLAFEKSGQGPAADEANGTWAVIELRHSDGSEEKLGAFRMSEGGANPYVINLDGKPELWNEFKHEGQEAFMLWDSDRRFATD